MINNRRIIYFIFALLSLVGCSQILEPVLLKGIVVDSVENTEDEFNIDIYTLNFKNALKANTAPYPRKIMLTGNGARANVFNEKDFLTVSIPESLKGNKYIIGVGDELSFKLVNEYKSSPDLWPAQEEIKDYLLGAGDELTFILYEGSSEVNLQPKDGKLLDVGKEDDRLLKTSGVIGSNGNILLIGVGNILAVNRTLNDLRTEVRNILIRNGLTPNFQLEIGSFRSKKAYIVNRNNGSETLSLNNIPISLKEVALSAGMSKSDGNFTQIKLTRNNKNYRLSALQLFDPKRPQIFIKDKDQIEINISRNQSKISKAIVGSKGNILLPEIGTLKAKNRSLSDLQKEINNILNEKGLLPNFQLEIVKFQSKKIFIYQKNIGSSVVPLTNVGLTLKELILTIGIASTSDDLAVITLKRNDQIYRLTLENILDPKTPDIWLHGNDYIEIENLVYKPGQVYALSGSNKAATVPIKPSQRETLADIIFSPGGALSNSLVKRSEIYLLRGKNPSIAYHLNAQSVSKILVAAKTELRPNDIIYVAERPIISFSRVLSEITPLRILLRDIQNDNIP